MRIRSLITLFLLVTAGSCSEPPSYQLAKGELFPQGKLVGQPYSSRHPDIRMVRVYSVDEADSFYMALKDIYPQCKVEYTHRVPADTYEVGVIRIRDSAVIARGIREIHFVETIKIKRR